MKAHRKTNRPQRDLLTPRKTTSKRTDKPWQLQYQWTDRQLFDKRLFGKTARFATWTDQFPGRMGCFIDAPHAITELEKNLRTGNCVLCEHFYAGREWRLFHLETKETIPLRIDLQTKQVTIHEKD